MKRIVLLLSLIFVLCACVQVNSPANTEETVLRDVFIIQGELPDIGEFSGNMQHGRFYEEYTPDFIPSDKYGKIIPYIGNYKEYSNNDSSNEITNGYPSYGFCTTDGKIVMDASSKTVGIYYRETYDGFGYYTVSRNMKQREDAPDESYAEEKLVIPVSGEWCIRLDKNESVSQAGGGVIVIIRYTDEDYQNSISTLYDYSGNRLTEFTGYDSYGVYTQGFMAAAKYGWNTGEKYSVSFINIDGEVVFGPYSSTSNFQQSGTAYVSDFEGNSYLIDTSGNRITEKNYSQISLATPTGGDRVIYTAKCADGGTDILDGYGNIIGYVDTNQYVSVSLPKNGEIICYYNNYSGNYYGEELVWKCLYGGSDFVSREYGVMPNQYYYDDDMYVHKADDGKAIVFDGNGETIAVIDDWQSISQLSPNGRYLVYTSGEYDYSYSTQVPQALSPIRLHIYDTYDKKDVFAVDGDGYVSFVGKDGRYALVHSAERFTMFGGYNSYYLYDTVTNEVLFDGCRYIESQTFNGKTYYSVCTDNSNTLYDGDMNVVLRLYNE